MPRIVIRPYDLARLARRFDAVADDLTRSRRRIARAFDEVQPNRADPSFPAARFAERTRTVESNLRRLADGFRVDAGLMSRTVDGAEFDGEGAWTAGLGAVAPAGSPDSSGRSVGSWRSAVGGLTGLVAGLSAVEPARSPEMRPVGPGGLFALAAVGRDEEVSLLDRLALRLGRSPRPERGSGAVWSRIVGELFTADDPE